MISLLVCMFCMFVCGMCFQSGSIGSCLLNFALAVANAYFVVEVLTKGM